MNVWSGQPYPLGATWDGSGVNFALFSESATKVDLCLFGGADGNEQTARIPLRYWVLEMPKLEYLRQLDELRVKQEAARGELEKLVSAREGAWQDLRAGTEHAWNEFRSAVESAAKRFQ